MLKNIVFADANFKSILVNAEYVNAVAMNLNLTTYVTIDVNNDNEISFEEASNIGALSIYSQPVADLSGLEYFTNVKNLRLISESLTSFNFPALDKIETLDFGFTAASFYYTVPICSLTNLNLSAQSNLKTLKLNSSLLSSLDLSNNLKLHDLEIYIQNSQFNLSMGNPNLKSIICDYKVPYNFNFSIFPKLTNLHLLGSGLTTINTTNNLKLANLVLSNTNVSSLDLSTNQNLEAIQLQTPNLETLELGTIKYIRNFYVQGTKLTSLDLSNQFNLNQLDCSGNLLTSLKLKNGILEELINFSNNPNLLNICCDANEIVYVQNKCNLLGYTTNISACIPPPVEARPLTMFPNPVKDMLHLDCSDKINRVEVFGSNGLLLMTSDSVTDIIDMQSFANGMCFLKVYRDNSVDDIKFIKG